MATRWIGTKQDPALSVHWRYAVVHSERTVVAAPDTIFVDVGSSYGPGAIDHHHLVGDPCSATRLLVRRPDFVFDHLVTPWRAAARARRPDDGSLQCFATIVMHDVPDFDALAAAHLARKLVEDGELPPYAEALAWYADSIDQGREALSPRDLRLELYPLILALAHEWNAYRQRANGGDPVGAYVDDAERLIAAWAEAVIAAPKQGAVPFDPRRTTLAHGAAEGLVDTLSQKLKADVAVFESMLQEKRVLDEGEIEIPLRVEDGARTTLRLAAASIPEFKECVSNRFYLRAGWEPGRRFPLTVIRRPDTRSTGRAVFTIAIDPAQVRDASLKGLGIALEIEEQRERRRQQLVDDREGPPRYTEFPGIADPWYDGRGHEWTIVDSPRLGTVLSYPQILAVLKRRFWEPTVEFGALGRVADGVLLKDLESEEFAVALERVGHARGAAGERGFLLMRCHLREEWGSDPLERLARAVCGLDPHSMEVAGLQCHFGREGLLLSGRHQEHDREVVAEIHEQLRRIERLRRKLEEVEKTIQGGGDSKSQRRLYSGFLRQHAETVAEFNSGRSRATRGEVLELVRRLEEHLDLAGRIEAVGKLLTQLHEDSERLLAAKLNRLVFLLALYGVLQTAATIWTGEANLTVMAWLFGLLTAGAVLCFVPWFARLGAKIPVIGELVFGDQMAERGRR